MSDARALAGHLRLHPGRRDGPAISGGRPDWRSRRHNPGSQGSSSVAGKSSSGRPMANLARSRR